MKLIPLVLSVLLFSCTGGDFYDINLVNLRGETVSMEVFRKKNIIIYLWTGTCTGHTRDLKKLSKLAEGKNLKGKVISVALLMTPEDVIDIHNKNGIRKNFPIYADPEGKTAEKFKIIFLPATILISPRGKVLENHPGLSPKLLSFVLTHN